MIAAWISSCRACVANSSTIRKTRASSRPCAAVAICSASPSPVDDALAVARGTCRQVGAAAGPGLIVVQLITLPYFLRQRQRRSRTVRALDGGAYRPYRRVVRALSPAGRRQLLPAINSPYLDVELF